MKRFIYLLILLALVFLQSTCGPNVKNKIIRYDETIYTEFGSTANVGRVIPLTVSKAAEVDGHLSRDSRFLFYATNKKGNFDIYLRDTGNITNKAITEHASEDRYPQLSPDGQKLIFMSKRDDPSGDIYIVEAKPEYWLTKNEPVIDEVSGKNKLGDLNNLTEVRNDRNVRVSIIDTSPIWHPDGEKIVFVSNRGPEKKNNLWIMNNDGSAKKQLTTLGAEQPCFSPDGKRIIYISYRDGAFQAASYGEIYELYLGDDWDILGEKRITNNNEIELFPSYMDNADRLLFSRIALDSNEDGILDLQDRSIINYWNRKENIRYPLTTSQSKSFAVSFISKAFNRENMIVYTAEREANLDIVMIPESGIIPRRANIRSQYLLAERYLTNFDDPQRYILGLRRTMDFHKQHWASYIFIPRAFVDISLYHISKGQRQYALEAIRELDEYGRLTNDENQDAQFSIYRILAETQRRLIAGRDSLTYLSDMIKEYANRFKEKIADSTEQKPSKQMNELSSLYEIMGDLALYQDKSAQAMIAYRQSLDLHSKYPFYNNVQRKLGLLEYEQNPNFLRNDDVPPVWISLLQSGSSVENRLKVEASIIDNYKKQTNFGNGLAKIERLRNRYRENKYIEKIYSFVASYYSFNLSDYDKSEKLFSQLLKKLKKDDPLYFSSLYYLGRIYEAQDKKNNMAKYYMAAIKAYSPSYRDNAYHEIKYKLTDLFESMGRISMLKGKYQVAGDFYEALINLMHELNVLGLSKDLYDERAVQAHVLYIDARIRQYSADEGTIVSFIEQYNRENTLELARNTFNTAYIYGAAYLYHSFGLRIDRNLRQKKNPSKKEVRSFIANQKMAEKELQWVIYMNEEFLEAYLLQGYIYSLLDIRRLDFEGKFAELYNDYFPEYLLEATIPIYTKALNMNDESRNPEMEANFYLNLGNSFYLLNNYPQALENYEKSIRYKNVYDSLKQEALFNFHLAYSYWQNGNFFEADKYFTNVKTIYQSQKNNKENNNNTLSNTKEVFRLMFYMALIKRERKQYRQALDLYNQILVDSEKNPNWLNVPIARIYQEISFCYYNLDEPDRAIDYLDKASKAMKKLKREKKQKYQLRWRILNFSSQGDVTFDTGIMVPMAIPNLIFFRWVDKEGIPFFDLGEDNAVIGDNRIFRTLYRNEMERLNYSLLVDNYLLKGDRNQAIRILEEKWQSLYKPKTQFEWQVKAVTGNNLGYHYFQIGQYAKSIEYFNKTSEVLRDGDYKDFEAEIQNRINRAMVIYFLLETRLNYFDNPLNTIKNTISELENYQDKFQMDIYKQLIEEEEEKKSVLNEKINDHDRQRIKEYAEKKAQIVLFKNQILRANFYLYQANVLLLKSKTIINQENDFEKLLESTNIINFRKKYGRSNETRGEKNLINKTAILDAAFASYRQSITEYEELITLMLAKKKSGRLTRLTGNQKIELPDNIRNNKRLLVVLYANQGRAYQALYKNKSAIVNYLRALRYSGEYGYDDITINVSYYIGQLLEKYPNLEDHIKEVLRETDEDIFAYSYNPMYYYNQAIQLLKNDLNLARNENSLIDRLFTAAIKYLINEKDDNRSALTLVDLQQQIYVASSLQGLAPEFGEPNEQRKMFAYYAQRNELQTVKYQLTLARENLNEKADIIPSLIAKNQSLNKKMENLRREIVADFPYLSNFFIEERNINNLQKEIKDGEIILIYKIIGQNLCTWLISNSNVLFFQQSKFTKNIYQAIKDNQLNQISDLILSPLAKNISKANRIIVVPDDLLYQLPIAALSYKDNNQRITLSEKHKVSYLISPFEYGKFDRKNNIYRNNYQAVGIVDPLQESEHGITIYPPVMKWEDLHSAGKAGLLELAGNLDIRKAFLLQYRPAFVMVDLNSVPGHEINKMIRLWSVLGKYWRTSSIYFYDNLDLRQRQNIIQSIHVGSSKEIYKALGMNNDSRYIEINNEYSAKNTRFFGYAINFYSGNDDFNQENVKLLDIAVDLIRQNIEIAKVNLDIYSLEKNNKDLLYTYGEQSAPKNIVIEYQLNELEKKMIQQDWKNANHSVELIEKNLNDIQGKQGYDDLFGRFLLLQYQLYGDSQESIDIISKQKERIINFARNKNNKQIPLLLSFLESNHQVRKGIIDEALLAYNDTYQQAKNILRKNQISKAVLDMVLALQESGFHEQALIVIEKNIVNTENIKGAKYLDTFIKIAKTRSLSMQKKFAQSELLLEYTKNATQNISNGHFYNVSNFLLMIKKKNDLDLIFKVIDSYLSNLTTHDSPKLIMVLNLFKSTLLEEMRRFPEAIQLLLQGYFSHTEYLEKWPIQYNIERFTILAKSLASMDQNADYLKIMDDFIHYLIKFNYNELALMEYYYVVLNLYKYKRYKDVLVQAEKSINFAKRRSIPGLLQNEYYQDISLFGFDAAAKTKDMNKVADYYEMMKSLKGLPEWRLWKRDADLLMEQKDYLGAGFLYQRLLKKLTDSPNVINDRRYEFEIEESFKSIIFISKINKDGKALLEYQRKYYHWKYENSRLRKNLLEEYNRRQEEAG